jgi:hypothetical protein
VPGGLLDLLANKESDDDLLSQAQCLLSLARERFTVLFGMGRGGSTLLWSSDKGVRIKANLIGCTWTQHSNCLGCFAILRSLSQLLYVTQVFTGASGRRFNALSLYLVSSKHTLLRCYQILNKQTSNSRFSKL